MIIYLLVVIAVAAWSYEIAYSDLSTGVKRILGLLDKNYHPLLYISTWQRALGKAYLVLLPFITVLVLLRLTHEYVSELLMCPFCISFWLMWAVNLWVFGMPVLPSIILSTLAIPIIAIIDRLRN